MFEPTTEESKTTVFPVDMYKVSREWIDKLFNEIKRVIMTRAIASDCSKEFLADLNELELSFGSDAAIMVRFLDKNAQLNSGVSTYPSASVSSSSTSSLPEALSTESFEETSAQDLAGSQEPALEQTPIDDTAPRIQGEIVRDGSEA